MSLLLSLHKSPEGSIVALCDKSILGKHFEEKGIVLDIKKGFFGGKSASKKEVSVALSACMTANIVGNEAVAAAIRCGAISEAGVKSVAGVKYAMLFRI